MNKFLSLCFLISFTILQFSLPAFSNQDKSLRVHFIDVGYGDATFLEFPDHTNIMIDAAEDIFAAKVVDYLQSNNVEKINKAIITHPHKNHFDGFLDIIKKIPIEEVFINGDKNVEGQYTELLNRFKEKEISIVTLKRNDTIWIDDESASIHVLHPDSLEGNPNNNSLVLNINFDGKQLLLMGDVELPAQAELLEVFGEVTKADYIKVPHHGGPLGKEFIDSFVDKIFFIHTGENPFGWPREEEIKQLKGDVYRTDQHGTIVLEFNRNNELIETANEIFK